MFDWKLQPVKIGAVYHSVW